MVAPALKDSSSRRQSPLSGALDDIRRRYLAGETGYQIAATYGVEPPAVYARLRKMGCTARDASQAQRKHTCDDAFFDVVDTPVKAYWLGFLAADGCVKSGRPQMHINLQIGDRAHLEALRTDLAATNEVRVHAGKHGYDPIASFLITSRQLCDGLIKHGVVERKSLIIKPPEFLTDSLAPHWVRGYFDGNGSVSGHGRSIKWNLVSTGEVLNWIADTISRSCGFPVPKPTKSPKRSIWCLDINGAGHLTALRDYLYPQDDDLRCLLRKRDKLAAVQVRSPSRVLAWARRQQTKPAESSPEPIGT